jgi:hypothetical protein
VLPWRVLLVDLERSFVQESAASLGPTLMGWTLPERGDRPVSERIWLNGADHDGEHRRAVCM